MSDILDFLSDMFPIMLPAVERSPQSRADRAVAVAIEDWRGREIMCENLFSDAIISLSRAFA